MNESITDFHEQVKDQLSMDEFMDRIREKIELMGGLCDEYTASLLVMHDLGINVGEESTRIGDITEDSGEVRFTGELSQVVSVRDFSRNNGSVGRVANLELYDETGSIRVVLWDEFADYVKTGAIQIGSELGICGRVKSGYSWLEVSVGRGGSLNIIGESGEGAAAVSQTPDKAVGGVKCSISELEDAMQSVNLTAKILETSQPREFTRKDGTTGKVLNVSIGDETGCIRLVIWGDEADEAVGIGAGETIEISNAYTKTGYGSIELHVGNMGSVSKSDRVVEYREQISDIADVKSGGIHSIQGNVTGIELARDFTKKDGAPGRVAGIHVSDGTGRIRISLWDEKADLINSMDIGTKVRITDASARTGLNGEPELSIGWRGTINLQEDSGQKPGNAKSN